MSDTTPPPVAETQQQNIDQILHKFEQALGDHRNTTKGELEAIARDLRAAIADSDGASKKDRDELRESLKAVTAWIEKEEQTRADRDKTKGDQNTLVAPPADVTPAQPNPPTPEHEPANQPPGQRRGLLKRLW